MKTARLFTLLIITCIYSSISAQTVSLGNKIWWDINDNGLRDSGEPVAGSMTVSLYRDNDDNGIADAGFTTITTITDGSGNYAFTGLTPGRYFIRVDAGWSHYVSTAYGGDPDNDINNDNNGHTQNTTDFYIYSQTITLSPGAEADGTGATNTNTNNTLDVGMWKGNGLGDRVWLDDGNGVQDPGEPGIANVTVKLKNAAGVVLATTTTDAFGKYFFYDPAGYYGTTDYQIEFVSPVGYKPTSCNMGSDDAMDNDAVNGIISTVNVPWGKWDHSFDAGFIPDNVVLPLQLATFTAQLRNNKVDLNWATLTETNLNHFVVEKSTNGTEYSEAGIVFATGNSSDRVNYSLSDNIGNIQSGVIYYRLRSVDKDGKGQLSETRIIRISKTSLNSISIVTYPNPVSNELRITVPAEWQNKKALYEVITLGGQVVRRTETGSSSQTETVNVSSLAPGAYLVRVSCDGQMAQQKIIKH